MAAGLPTLQTASLGATPGSSGAKGFRKRRPEQPGAQPDGALPTGNPSAQPQTFAQLQQAGVARPAPPPQASAVASPASTGAIPQYQGSQQATQVRGQLQDAVGKALNAPSRYDTPAFTSIRDAAYADLNNQFARIRDTTNTDLARRGLSASTIGGNALYDVDSAQSRAMGDLNASLLKDAAATQASDRSQAYGMGSDLAGMAGAQDLSTYTANANASNQSFQNQLAQMLGLGNLDLQKASVTGTYNGESTLGAKALEQSGSQFDKSYGLQQQQADLAKALGLGNLDLQNKSLTQSGQQFNMQQALAEKLGLGNLDLQGKSLAQSGDQFSKDLSLRESQANASNDLAKATLAQSGSQFDKSYGLQSDAQQTQAQQFKEQLSQALGIAQMQNDTSNRGITAQQSTNQSDFLYKLLATMTSMSADQIKKLVGSLGTGTATTGTTASSVPRAPTSPNPVTPGSLPPGAPRGMPTSPLDPALLAQLLGLSPGAM